MYQLRRNIRATLSALLFGMLFSIPSHALDIILNDIGATPMSAAQLAAFRQAADDWENTFSDPITVYAEIAFDELDPQTLGSTWTARTTHPYDTVKSAMLTDVLSAYVLGTTFEKDAIQALPNFSLPVEIFSGPRSESSITLATANAKALGLGTARDSLYGSIPSAGKDMRIIFNTLIENDFDYDESDGISPSKTDFVAVARHEIGHGLGFISATDVQDGNQIYTVRASTLDIWRFEETGGAHDLTTERRFITAGDAEHYDSNLNNVTLSHGVALFDPLCNSSTMHCQASHWSDDQGNLLDPTLAPGVLQTTKSPDIRALDYIGYNRPQLFICCIELIPRWDFWWLWPFDEIPIIDEPDYPFIPEIPQEIPEWANLGWASVMDIGALGRRSGIGFARFEPGGQIDGATIEPSENVEGTVNLNPPVEPMFEKPPALFELSFISDEEAGVPFTMTGTCGELGCEFDPTIGEFGGYRITGIIDALGDGEEDIDGRFTLVLAADEQGVPNGDDQNIFKLDDRTGDSVVKISDYDAFGLETPPDSDGDGVPDTSDNCTEHENSRQRDTNGDGFGNVCDPDLNNDGIVNFLDISLFANLFNTANDGDADFNGDGFVNFLDFAIFPEFFLGNPGPSGINP